MTLHIDHCAILDTVHCITLQTDLFITLPDSSISFLLSHQQLVLELINVMEVAQSVLVQTLCLLPQLLQPLLHLAKLGAQL